MGVVDSVRGANSDSGSDGVVAVDSGNTSAHRLGSWPDAAQIYSMRLGAVARMRVCCVLTLISLVQHL